jgi:hypothetical protein
LFVRINANHNIIIDKEKGDESRFFAQQEAAKIAAMKVILLLSSKN